MELSVRRFSSAGDFERQGQYLLLNNLIVCETGHIPPSALAFCSRSVLGQIESLSLAIYVQHTHLFLQE